MLTIGVDIHGGDFAPLTVLEGVRLALPFLHRDTSLCFIGDEKVILEYAKSNSLDLSKHSIEHTSDVLQMDDDIQKAIHHRPKASIFLGSELFAQSKISAFCSSGNTGGALMGMSSKLGFIEHLSRPCVCAHIARPNQSDLILLDVGLNSETKAEYLVDFAKLGALYAKESMKLKQAKIGLLNTGKEKSKGEKEVRKAFDILSGLESIDFKGNFEASEIFKSDIDVLVCGGFVGNSIVKFLEALYDALSGRGIKDALLEEYNYENHGGAIVLGGKGDMIIGHGASSAEANRQMILRTEKIAQIGLSKKIENAFIKYGN